GLGPRADGAWAAAGMAVEGLLEGERRMSTAGCAWPSQMAKTLAGVMASYPMALGVSRDSMLRSFDFANRAIDCAALQRARARGLRSLGYGHPPPPMARPPPPQPIRPHPKIYLTPKSRGPRHSPSGRQ